MRINARERERKEDSSSFSSSALLSSFRRRSRGRLSASALLPAFPNKRYPFVESAIFSSPRSLFGFLAKQSEKSRCGPKRGANLHLKFHSCRIRNGSARAVLYTLLALPASAYIFLHLSLALIYFARSRTRFLALDPNFFPTVRVFIILSRASAGLIAL